MGAESRLLTAIELVCELPCRQGFRTRACDRLGVRRERVAQTRPRTEEEGVDGRSSKPEPVTDLRGRAAVHSLQHERLALPRRERVEGSYDVVFRSRVLGPCRVVRFVERLLARALREATETLVAQVACDREQPGALVGRPGATDDRAMRVEEGRLGDILGVSAVADVRVGDCEHVPAVPAVENLDRRRRLPRAESPHT